MAEPAAAEDDDTAMLEALLADAISIIGKLPQRSPDPHAPHPPRR